MKFKEFYPRFYHHFLSVFSVLTRHGLLAASFPVSDKKPFRQPGAIFSNHFKKFVRNGCLTTICAMCFSVAMAENSLVPIAKPETKEQRDLRMGWWREAKFGMFIHWGVYSVPAGIYQGKPVGGIGEWIMNKGKIPMADYQAFAREFNPVKYNPESWVKAAKDAGMKYIIITSKHHDGFAMFETKASPWNIVQASPYAKDVLRPLADACRKEGIKLGFYYSQAQDWNNGGSASGGKWDKAQEHSMDDYIEQVAVPQVRELLTNYGPDIPAVVWWDTPTDMNQARADKLYAVIEKLRPDLIMNNRLGGGYQGDTETPEQHIPARGYPGRDWESCMTMNNTWGFKSDDQNWKSTSVLIRNLCDIASKGGNYLLNVGPTAEGEIPGPSLERLTEVGKWMSVNGESIYGTHAGPLSKAPAWGRVSAKGPDGAPTLYLHIFEWPHDGKLIVPGISTLPKSAVLLASSSLLTSDVVAGDLVIQLPAQAPDAIASVLKLDFNHTLAIEKRIPVQTSDGILQLDALSSDVNNVLGSESAMEKINGIPTIVRWNNDRVTVNWICEIKTPGTYSVEADYDAKETLKADIKINDKKAAEALFSASGKTISIGTVTIPNSGEMDLKIVPQKPWKEIVLRQLRLVPVSSTK